MRRCEHPGCKRPRQPGHSASWCIEHGSRKWERLRAKNAGVRQRRPRSEAAIRADLARMLEVVWGRWKKFCEPDVESLR